MRLLPTIVLAIALCLPLADGALSTDLHQDAAAASDAWDPFHAAEGAARTALAAGSPSDALAALDRAAAELRGPPPAAHLALRAHVLSALGRHADALAAAELPAGPDHGRELEAARALTALGRHGDALARLDATLAHYPRFAAARRERAFAHATGGRADLARADLEQLVAQLPADAGVLLAAARAAFDAGERDAARARVEERLAELGDDPERVLRTALVEWWLADGHAAEAFAAAAPLIAPDAPEHALLVALRAAHAAGRPLDAWRAAAHALEAAPESTRALDALAPLVAGAPELELALAEERLRRTPEAWVARDVAERRAARGDVDGALAALASVPVDARRAHAAFEGRLLRRAGRGAEARAVLAAAAEFDGEAAYELGLAEAELGALDAALAAFARARDAALAPARVDAALAADAEQARAAVLERAGRHAEAARALEEALRHDARRADAWLRLAQLARSRLGDAERALAAYRRHLELGGDDAEGRAYVEAAEQRARGGR